MDVVMVLDRLQTLALVLARVSGIVFVAPPFFAPLTSSLARGVLSLVLSLVVLPVVPVWTSNNPWLFIAAAGAELLLGLSIGFLTLLLFLAVQGAGDLIDLELGFGMANVINPQFGQPVPLLGNFLYILCLLLFLMVDGHLLVLHALLNSFDAIPPGAGRWDAPVFSGIFQQFGWVITTAVRLALPVMGTLFLVTVALGIVARTMPQLNAFVIGLPLRIGVGLLIILFVLPTIVRVFLGGIDTVFQGVDGFLREIGGGGGTEP